MRRSSSGSLYGVLGVTNDASQSDIKKAYHKKALQLHPDKTNGTTTEEFKQVQEANAILSDPEKRKLYDTFGRSGMAKMEQYDMSQAASIIVASRPLILTAFCYLWLFLLALQTFVVLACIKVDYQEPWTWKSVFAPIYFVSVSYIVPLALCFIYTGLRSRKLILVSLGLYLLAQSAVWIFFAQSLDMESDRFDHLLPHASPVPQNAVNTKGHSKPSHEKQKHHSNEQREHYSKTYDREAFESWQLTFLVQFVAMGFYTIFVLSSLTLDSIRQELQVRSLGTTEVDISYSSSAYLSTVLNKLFYLSCKLAFVVLLGYRLCGYDPNLNFYIIFSPIFLGISLVPFLVEIKNLLCSPSKMALCARICSLIFVVMTTYTYLYTFIMLAEKLQRSYDIGGISDPSAFTCSLVVISSLTLLNVFFASFVGVLLHHGGDILTGGGAFSGATDGGSRSPMYAQADDDEDEMWHAGTASDAASNADVRANLMRGHNNNNNRAHHAYGTV